MMLGNVKFDEGFHVFDIPRCIVVKGDAAKQAVIKLFSNDKIVEQMGKFHVYVKE